MNNPQLFKVIKEGLNAPPGSTKRVQAKSMLAVSNKIRNNFYSGQGGGSVTNLLQPTGSANMMNTTYNPQKTSSGLSISQTSSSPTITTKKPSQETLNIQAPTPNKRDIVVGIPLPKTNVTGINLSSSPVSTPIQNTTTTNIPSSTPTVNLPPQPIAQEDIIPPYGNNAEGLLKWYQENPTDFQKYTNKVLNISTPLGPSERPTNIPSAMWSDVVSAVENKIGKETWTMQALPKLKQWFGDTIPEEELPVGAIWTDELPEIKNRLKEEAGLDSKLANLQKMEAEGLTIEDDLQSYIRGRDKYITNIDKMIDNVNSLYTTTDVSDPTVRKMLDKYRNYLYISKGRQSMKYDQYIKTSVKEFEAKQKRLQDEYNNALSNFKTAYSEEKDITKERYSWYKGMLEDLYNNLEEQSKDSNDIIKNEIERLENIKDIISYTVESTGGSTLTPTQTSSSQQNYIKMHPALGDSAIDSWNKLSSTDKLRWADADTPKIALQEYLDSNPTLTDSEKIKTIRGYGFKPSDFGIIESLNLDSLINLD